MFTNTRILFSLIFLMVCSAADAQEQIERLFRGDRQNTAIDVAQTSDEGYLFLSAGKPMDSIRFQYLTVTKVDNKTNMVWSMDYSFEHKVIPSGSITLLEGDSFVISGVLDTTSINKVLMKADPGGTVVWTRGFGRDDMNAPPLLGEASVDISYQNGFYLAGDVYTSATNNEIYLAEADTMGMQLWGKSYSKVNGIFNTAKVRMTQDSGAIICGTSVNVINPNIFLVKTDSLGNIEWSRDYGEDLLAEIGTTVAPTPDGGYLIGGRKINPLFPSHPGILIKTDTFGNEQWTRNVDFQTSDSILINDIAITADGNAIVSGSLLGAVDNFAFMVKIDMDGDVIWKRRYKASTRQFTFSNGLLESPVGGYVYLTSSDEDMGGGDMQVGPYLIKTDENGQTICDSIVDEQLLYNETIPVDTLILTTTDIDDTKEITVVDTLIYNGFSLVTLELESFGPYCPDEIFSDTLDATVGVEATYEWSTGETSPTIVVSEFDDYMVTVTVLEDYCYQLCGTITISPLPLPMIESIEINDDGFCTTGEVTVSVSTTDVDDIIWSTGETESSITVDAEGTYMVTVSNGCGSTTGETTVVFDTAGPSLEISGTNTFCATGEEVLTVNYTFGDAVLWSTNEVTDVITVSASGTYSVTVSSNFCEDGIDTEEVEDTPLSGDVTSDGTLCADGSERLSVVGVSSEAVNYLWSTGDTTSTIAVDDSGLYTVVVSDFCDDLSLEFTVVENSDISVTITGDTTLCEDGDEVLSTNLLLAKTYAWSTGEATPTITITAQGTYAITVTDFCDQEASDDISITCPIEFYIGNLFTPNNDDLSDTFIPEFSFDPSSLAEYEFIVYSRWGKKVFETNDPLEGWDGMVGDKPGISDVYFFTINGVNDLERVLTRMGAETDDSKVNHGDVTLIR